MPLRTDKHRDYFDSGERSPPAVHYGYAHVGCVGAACTKGLRRGRADSPVSQRGTRARAARRRPPRKGRVPQPRSSHPTYRHHPLAADPCSLLFPIGFRRRPPLTLVIIISVANYTTVGIRIADSPQSNFVAYCTHTAVSFSHRSPPPPPPPPPLTHPGLRAPNLCGTQKYVSGTPPIKCLPPSRGVKLENGRP